MDIFSYGESINFSADYYEASTGLIYHLQEYGNAKKLGLPTPYEGIRVSENGKTIGYAKENI